MVFLSVRGIFDQRHRADRIMNGTNDITGQYTEQTNVVTLVYVKRTYDVILTLGQAAEVFLLSVSGWACFVCFTGNAAFVGCFRFVLFAQKVLLWVVMTVRFFFDFFF